MFKMAQAMPLGWIVIKAVDNPLLAPLFEESFDVVASAPGRVNLIGEHTDYNGGQVLPIGIGQRTYVGARIAPNHSRHSRVVSANEPRAGTFDARNPEVTGQWWDYILGVIHAFRQQEVVLPQIELMVVSDVPVGAGLSSSAALEVATTLALARLVERPMSSQEVVMTAWRAETEFVGVPSGIMDQYASVAAQEGYAVHLWCDTGRTELIPCRENILIFDTGIPRSLRQSHFAQRQAECAAALQKLQCVNPRLRSLADATLEDIRNASLSPTLARRARHVVSENGRVEAAVRALQQGESLPGELLVASHVSLRDDFECSCPELDWFVEQAIERNGVRGARLTGAGWGGCAIATGEPDALREAAAALVPPYEKRFNHVARTWLTRPDTGARVEL
jgi:galactokinase